MKPAATPTRPDGYDAQSGDRQPSGHDTGPLGAGGAPAVEAAGNSLGRADDVAYQLLAGILDLTGLLLEEVASALFVPGRLLDIAALTELGGVDAAAACTPQRSRWPPVGVDALGLGNSHVPLT